MTIDPYNGVPLGVEAAWPARYASAEVKLVRESILAAALAAALAISPATADVPTPADQAARIEIGRTTQPDVRQLLGRPAHVMWLRAEEREAWGYRYSAQHQRRVLWIEWAPDGTVHAKTDLPDYEAPPYRWP